MLLFLSVHSPVVCEYLFSLNLDLVSDIYEELHGIGEITVECQMC